MGNDKLLLRLFKSSSKFKIYLSIGIEIIFQGFWLGVMDNESLNDITRTYFSSCYPYQDEEYNLSGFFGWEIAALNNYFKDCTNVLVGAAGGGREIIALFKRGIMADGFECNPRLVDECKHLLEKVGINCRVIPAENDKVPEEFGIYDGFIVGWGAYMHIIGREARIHFLEQARRHIKPEGPILLSFWHISGSKKFNYMIIRIGRIIRTLRRSKKNLEFGDSLNPQGFCHRFTKEEIEAELREAGFNCIYYSDNDYAYAIGRVS
jgi:hypothetical protein